MKKFFSAGIASVSICFLLAGCGEKIKDAPKTGTVTGVVTSDGKPVAGAIVEFFPNNEKGTRGPQSTGFTDAEGKYELNTTGSTHGAVIGFHRVTVNCQPPVSQSSTSNGSAPPAPPGEPCKLPAKYNRLDTSKLEYEVKSGPNEIDLDLKP